VIEVRGNRSTPRKGVLFCRSRETRDATLTSAQRLNPPTRPHPARGPGQCRRKRGYEVLRVFAARIRDLNTREAYARACAQFLAWPEQHVDDLRLIKPMHAAGYIEQHPGSPQTIKQHLAAIKMLLDYLVVNQIVQVNPAALDRADVL
jgi:hypothetical protein